MEYYYVLLALVSVSIVCQISFAVLIFIIWARESDQEKKEEHITSLKKVNETFCQETQDDCLNQGITKKNVGDTSEVFVSI